MDALFGGLFDYAGLFPPAALDLEPAVNAYRRHRTASEAFTVSRFVCKASALPALDEILGTQPLDGEELPIAVIGSHGGPERFAHDAEAMEAFDSECEHAFVDAYETAIHDAHELKGTLKALRALRNIDLFVELPPTSDWEHVLPEIAEADGVFAKLRTDPAPPPERLAAFISLCLSLEVPFKLTAGLHSLFPSAEPLKHGLISVVGGAALAFAHDLNDRELARLLVVPAGDWELSDSLTTKGASVGAAEVDACREFFRSVGTCSIAEPWAEIVQWTRGGVRR